MDIVVIVMKAGAAEEEETLCPPQAVDVVNDDWQDGIGTPAAIAMDAWGNDNWRITVVQLAASYAGMWSRQVAQVYFDLRAIKVHDIPMQSTSADETAKNYAVTVRQSD